MVSGSVRRFLSREYGHPSTLFRAKSVVWMKIPNFCSINKAFPQGVASVLQKIISTPGLFYFELLVSFGKALRRQHLLRNYFSLAQVVKLWLRRQEMS